jgi:hypothetical protein
MSDDLRDRDPRPEGGDFPAEEGLRSDLGGTSATIHGAAPGGGEAPAGDTGARESALPVGDRETEPPTGQLTGAGGGYGVGSGRGSSGGSGEGAEDVGEDAETEWLRSEPSDSSAPQGQPASDEAG